MSNPDTGVTRSEATGVTRGIEWLLSVRSLPVRLAVLLALAAGCMIWLTESATVLDWAIAVAAVGATAIAVWRPLEASLLTTALLAVGFEFGTTGPLAVKVSAAVVLTELAARHGSWRPWLGAAALVCAYLLHDDGGLGATGYRALVMAGVPLLIGGLLRGALESAARARRAAEELGMHRAAEVAAARMAERTAIARELHDLIAHHVSSTVLRVGVARHAIPEASPAVREVLDDIHASGKETLADLRKLVTILRDPDAAGESFVAPGDLLTAIETAVLRTRRLGNVVTDEIGDVASVDALSALTLLRLTQEGLANVVEHGGPGASARLVVDALDGVHFLLDSTISNGHTKSRPSGVGLIGLAERVELLGGSFTAGPSATGWRLAAHLPGRAS
ncbi:sensor histidine kinase [Nocardia bhagyanarayanae]|uniref:sensor histidine kinase n=1 Tax=Nocardia bhagyanarayanae TaxID=1215925 RepID=UPI001FE79CDA|nr:histidine kinase [Nocardia bhagyanarayanae]